jgi:hypothetical protein
MVDIALCRSHIVLDQHRWRDGAAWHCVPTHHRTRQLSQRNVTQREAPLPQRKPPPGGPRSARARGGKPAPQNFQPPPSGAK